ncbi:hypothetical protein I302_105003 [Kwoniella bestiolae CBS 10118]|uniref:ELYS-like domain-containing protein n=1 Tax=Kwoniella bestiolae CBS 10118 TaxID=1296100 RepID=A0A1B9FR54_9TREE|nr:hypothetical protein I302_08925 [Kwoniella bestiolae CBS 10118]OCF21253.1 hypothetical protein I302_08925 [Kwoniella bestiolae CBS 10118]
MSSIDEFAIPNTILRHFDLSSTPWNDLTSPSIEKRRKELPEAKLFFDRLLELVGLDGASLYPPNTPAAIRRLLHSIHSLELDRLKKDCFYYYLLKDYDSSSAIQLQAQPSMEIDEENEGGSSINGKLPNVHGVPSKAQSFAKKRCMPLTWIRFMDGYWALDHGLYDTTVSSLSDPSITTLNFVPSILQTLYKNVAPSSHALDLIYNFLNSTHPELATREEEDIRLISLASAGSLSQAFALIRSNESPEERRRQRELVWLWILGSSSVGNRQQQHIQTKSLKELLHIPLSPEENQHLLDFLIHPPRRNIPAEGLSMLHDLITLRLIHQGQYAESLMLDKQLSGSGEKERQSRREMVREFISILPKAQRDALLFDMESNSASQVNGNGNGNEASEDIDMSSSWVNVNTTAPSNGPSYAQIASEPPTIPLPSAVPPQPTPATSASTSTSTPAPVAAPTPIKASTTHTSLFTASQNPSIPSPQKPSSPFSGPPRFSNSTSAGPSSAAAGQIHSPRRVLSGSPFNLPPSSKPKGSPATTPRLPKTIINDDDEDEEDGSVLGRRSTVRGKGRGSTRLGRGASMSVEPEPEPSASAELENVEENHPIETINEEPSSSTQPQHTEPPKSIRRSRKVVSGKEKSREGSITPPRSRSRQPTEPITPGLNGMPGAFSQDDEMPPPPPKLPESVQRGGRSRITRSASRAILDLDDGEEEDKHSPPPTKKPKSTRKPRASLAPSDISEVGSVTPSVRRSTRSRTGMSVGPSEQGSPTPSLGGRSNAGTGDMRRNTRAGSATPRKSTRSKR